MFSWLIVLTNVWAHKVFKCLAYVDTMRVMNTNKDASRYAEKVIEISNCLPIVIYFEEIPNYKKCPGYQTKCYPIETANTQLNKKAWVFSQLTGKLICFT